MAQSLARVLIHLVFSTKNRAPFLPQAPYPALHAYAQGILKTLKCHLIEMNNVTDHVHALFDLHRTESLSDVVMHVKKGTSRWLKEQSPDYEHFDWQAGYGAFSIGRSQRDDVVAHIRKQQDRHERLSFQEEFRKFLESYAIEYDERYDTQPHAFSVQTWVPSSSPGRRELRSLALGCPALHLRCENERLQ